MLKHDFFWALQLWKKQKSLAAQHPSLQTTFEYVLSSCPPTLENELPTVENERPSPQTTLENNVPCPQPTLDNELPSSQPTLDNELPSSQPTLDNELPSSQPTLDNELPSSQPTVDNELPSSQPTLDNELPSPQTVDNEPSLRQPTSENNVPCPQPTLDNELPSPQPTVVNDYSSRPQAMEIELMFSLSTMENTRPSSFQPTPEYEYPSIPPNLVNDLSSCEQTPGNELVTPHGTLELQQPSLQATLANKFSSEFSWPEQVQDKTTQNEVDCIPDSALESDSDAGSDVIMIMKDMKRKRSVSESTSGSEYVPGSDIDMCSPESSEPDDKPQKKKAKRLKSKHGHVSSSDSESESERLTLGNYTKRLKAKQGPCPEDETSTPEDTNDDYQRREAIHPTEGPDTDTELDEPLAESDIIRFADAKGLYTREIQHSKTTKDGKCKKSDRVYNAYQYCDLCKSKVSNFSQHIKRSRHNSSEEVADILKLNKKEQKNKFALMRLKFNDKYNMQSLKKGRGEIFLERRPGGGGRLGPVEIRSYGPCPRCRSWVARKHMWKHQKKCLAQPEEILSTAAILTQSDTLTGAISIEASSIMKREVFTRIRSDEVGQTAISDSLIIGLGNQWLEKNVGNPLKRAKYTQSIMRLNARLLLQLRQLKPMEKNGMSDYLAPDHFETLVEATVLTGAPSMDDIEDLEKPSNCIKLGFDIKRMINIKAAQGIMANDSVAIKEADDVRRVMEVFWATKITKRARVILQERHFNREQDIPLPSDLKKLNSYLAKEVSDLDLEDGSPGNFKHVAEVVAAKLTTYNRRRTGEMENLRVLKYKHRKTGETAMTKHVLGQCSALERKLIETQDCMEIRGKTGRGVPVIVPKSTVPALDFLADVEVRRKAHVKNSNPYLFADRGSGAIRIYDAIARMCKEADLEAPKKISSTTLRKLMATLIQALDLTEMEVDWVINHLGHSLDVHRINYRLTSPDIERTHIAKLLLLQDHQDIGKYANRRLSDIDLKDILFPDKDEDQAMVSNTGLSSAVDAAAVCTTPETFRILSHSEEFFHNEETEERLDGVKKTSRGKVHARCPWTKDEEGELTKLFGEITELPTTQQIRKAKRRSKETGGHIWQRSLSSVKNKLARLLN